MTYDNKVYTVKVTPEMARDDWGKLDVKYEITLNGNPVTEMTFDNTTEQPERYGKLLIRGTKTVNGKTPNGKTFKFVLKNAKGKVIETVYSTKSGKIAFDDIDFATEDIGKTFIYTISEIGTSKAFKNDSSVYTIKVTPKAAEQDGLLAINPVITKNGKVVKSIIFDNKTVKNTSKTPSKNPVKPGKKVIKRVVHKPKAPKTGDNTSLGLWVVLVGAASAVLITLLVSKRTRRK